MVFVLSIENEDDRTGHTGYCLPKVETKDYIVKNDGRNIFDKWWFKNIRTIATGHGDDYTTSCILDYHYFKENYMMTGIDLGKQQALDADPRAIQ